MPPIFEGGGGGDVSAGRLLVVIPLDEPAAQIRLSTVFMPIQPLWIDLMQVLWSRLMRTQRLLIMELS